jgi:hypothetical protein
MTLGGSYGLDWFMLHLVTLRDCNSAVDVSGHYVLKLQSGILYKQVTAWLWVEIFVSIYALYY